MPRHFSLTQSIYAIGCKPLKVFKVLHGDRYKLKSVNAKYKHTYKYPHDRLKRAPIHQVPKELDVDIESVEIDDADGGPRKSIKP